MNGPSDGNHRQTADEREAVLRGYDALAEEYAAERSADCVEMDALAALCKHLPDAPRVLDAGCGRGDPVLTALAGEAAAVGLDFSATQLELASEAAPTAALVRGDMTTLPFRDGSFDAVTAFHSLIHVPLTEHERVLDEFARVLAPDGTLLVTEGHEEWCGRNPDWLDTGVEMRWEIAGTERTRAHLRDAGFTIVDARASPDELADGDVTKPLFLARLE